MVMWERASEAWCRQLWDRTVCEAHDRNAFQSYAWGEYKRAVGWVPTRWIVRDSDGTPLAVAQILERSVPGGLTVCWSPGGPVWGYPRCSPHVVAAVLDGLQASCQSRGRWTYTRFCSQDVFTEGLAQACGQVFRRPSFGLTSGFTIRVNLTQPLDRILQEMRPKHRYYVKRALAEPIRWEAGNHPGLVQALTRLTADMARDKGLRLSDPDGEDLARLCQTMGEAVVLLAGHNMREQVVVACLVLVYGGKAFYLKAAAGREGRASSVSYAMIYQLFEYLQKRGITEFDFGGIVPKASAVVGVNHFKRGFGGIKVEYLGEWEWAASSWLRWAMNLGVRWRREQL